MTGGDGTKVNVVISADNIKPGTYSATWTPGVFGGSDPGRVDMDLFILMATLIQFK